MSIWCFLLLVAVLYLGGWGYPFPHSQLGGVSNESLVGGDRCIAGITMTVFKACLLIFIAILLR